MSRVIITLTDLNDGGCDTDVNFGPQIDEKSQAHQMAALCIKYLESNFSTDGGSWSYRNPQEIEQ